MGGENRNVIEEAILKALEYENRVREVYGQCVEQATDPIGKKVFSVLADEEQGHIDYLEHKLKQLRETGEVTADAVETALPTKQKIEAGIKKLEKKVSGADFSSEEELLRRALKVEEETSGFYKKMVDELPAEGRDFFYPFMTIEDGHVAIVQAELDSVTQSGFWFDYREFDLEAG